MTRSRRALVATVVVAVTAVAASWLQGRGPHYVKSDPASFAASFAPPPAQDSPEARTELDELLELQDRRSVDDARGALADRKTRIDRFYDAIGLDGDDPPRLPHLEKLAERVEDDVRVHVRAVKERYRRLRPYVIEPRLLPCIDDVEDDLSYPSGHAAFAFSMGSLLEQILPLKRDAIRARAEKFARQRMVCGVHFRSDIEAGRVVALTLAKEMNENPEFLEDLAAAHAELRKELRLGFTAFSIPAPPDVARTITRMLDARDQAFRNGDSSGVCRFAADDFEYVEHGRMTGVREPQSREEFEALTPEEAWGWHVKQTRDQYCLPADRLRNRKYDGRRRRTELRITVKPAEKSTWFHARYVLVAPAPDRTAGGEYYYSVLSETGEVIQEDGEPRIERLTALLEEGRRAREKIPKADRP